MATPWALSPEQARQLFRYNRAVFERFVRAAKRLSWKRAIQDRGSGHRSIFQTLVHILHVHEAWLRYIVEGRMKEFEMAERSPLRHPTSWKEFDRYASETWRAIARRLDTASAARLRLRVKAPWMRGRYTFSDALLQTTLEQAHHLGEVIAVFWQQDTSPPDMTWIDVNRALS